MYRYQPLTRGFSLIEVLIAVFIFSLGLIGLAGLLVMSTQSNQGAFIRTQATFLGQNMADRMRANPIGIWQGNYDASYPVSGTAPACGSGSPCAPADQALRDKIQWSNMLKQYLPNDANLAATITCTKSAGVATPSATDLKLQPPFAGTCALDINWTERSIAIGGSPSIQTFSWMFQP